MSIMHKQPRSHEQDDFMNIVKVRTLLIMGFASYVIEIETGVTQKRIRRVREELLAYPEFADNINRARSNKHATSRTLIRTYEAQQHATLLMCMYARLHKGYESRLDIIKLAKAYGHYRATLKTSCDSVPIYYMSINDAWALAIELREGDASFILCPNCKTYFYEAINQCLYKESKPCPWCD